MSIVINYDTGEIISGKIERPSAEFWINNVLNPFHRQIGSGIIATSKRTTSEKERSSERSKTLLS